MPTFRLLTRPVKRLARAFGVDIVAYPAALPDVSPEVLETVRVVQPYTMTSQLRLVALCDAVRYVVESRIEGDIVECGVWRGGSMMAVARTLLQLRDTDRHLHLFDTFEGMTDPGEQDVSFDGQRAAELMRASRRTESDPVWCYAPLETVRTALYSVGYDRGRIHFIRGRVEDTVPGQAPERIALLRLDTDWYESTRHELVHLYPRLSPGGVLMIDDYGHWQGARKAVDEYIAAHRLPLFLQRIDYTGRCAVKPR